MTEPPIRRLWIAATEPERACAPLGPGSPRDGFWHWWRHGPDASLVAGCGPVAAASSLAWFLATREVGEIVGIGIAGSLPGSGLAVGSVHRVVRDQLVESGAESGDGQFLPLPFEGLENPPLSLACLPDLAFLPTAEGITTSLATGTARSALRRRARGADLESMEGAAWAAIAARWGIPFAQVRAVSNPASFRDRDSWDIPLALRRLAETLASALDRS